MTRWRGVAAVAALIVIADQLSKAWALRALSDGNSIDLVWTLRFRLAFNTGMAFSRGSGLGPVIGLASLVIVAVVLVVLRRHQSLGTRLAGAAVVGGALGNIADRLFRNEGWMRGAVVDFIDLQWWPVFNIADMAVVLGGIALVASINTRTQRDQ